MATKNTGKPATKNEEQAVAEAISKSEEFFTKNKKALIYIGIIIVVLIAIGFAYFKFIRAPRKQEALAQMFPAEQYFRTDSFNLALNGDGNYLGFKDIIDEYKALPGQSVYFYAGISALQLGQYDEAIGYLTKYHAKDEIMQARAYCSIGDAYCGLEDLQKALSFYLKAAHYKDNAFAAGYLKKAGILYEELGDTANALSTYKIIKDKYPQTTEGQEVDKYISRIENAQ